MDDLDSGLLLLRMEGLPCDVGLMVNEQAGNDMTANREQFMVADNMRIRLIDAALIDIAAADKVSGPTWEQMNIRERAMFAAYRPIERRQT